MARCPATAAPRVDVIRVMDLLQTHITSALCRTVFRRVRIAERQRVWTLEALVRFWTAVILRAPAALSHALLDAVDARDPFVPRIVATPEAFFQRCRDLRPAFFAEVFRRFTASLAADVPARYAAPVAAVQARFAAIVLLDGSRLAAIARRLKLLWDERAVILPGCLLGVYDLGRGLCRALYFSADAAASEMTRAKAALAELAPDTLILGDRLYGTADFFATLHARNCWGLVRRNRLLSLHKLQRLSRRRHAGGCLEDWLVRAGAGATAPVQTLRYIRWRHGRTRHELLTNVLSPARLVAAEALALYPYRWRIERMYFDLKEVLNLNRIYAANPNAVAMQVYAAALVYNAMRVVQGEVAHAAGLSPEDLSPAKLYPKFAAACYTYVVVQYAEHTIRRRNPRAKLRPVNWRRERWASLPVPALCVEPRHGIRRKRRYCPARRHWKSLKHVRGGRRFLAKLS
jgi:Transposase DDE domain